MSKRHWQDLVRRYANGRPICNCKEAYLTPCAEGIDRDGIARTDMLACKHGCSCNLIAARDEIAGRVLEELGCDDART